MTKSGSDKECATCGREFAPIDNVDKFCKKCLRNLYLELIRDTEKNLDALTDRWKMESLRGNVELHRKICGVKRDDL